MSRWTVAGDMLLLLTYWALISTALIGLWLLVRCVATGVAHLTRRHGNPDDWQLWAAEIRDRTGGAR